MSKENQSASARVLPICGGEHESTIDSALVLFEGRLRLLAARELLSQTLAERTARGLLAQVPVDTSAPMTPGLSLAVRCLLADGDRLIQSACKNLPSDVWPHAAGYRASLAAAIRIALRAERAERDQCDLGGLNAAEAGPLIELIERGIDAIERVDVCFAPARAA